jgi:RHS repeat-associated protein
LSRSTSPPAPSPTWPRTVSDPSAPLLAALAPSPAPPATTRGATPPPPAASPPLPPFGYAGGDTDPTCLIYLINRYYDPTTGQFTSLDPAVDSTLQPYAYAAGDPIINTDPTGEYCSTNRAMLEMGQSCSSIALASGKTPYSNLSQPRLVLLVSPELSGCGRNSPRLHADRSWRYARLAFSTMTAAHSLKSKLSRSDGHAFQH